MQQSHVATDLLMSLPHLTREVIEPLIMGGQARVDRRKSIAHLAAKLQNLRFDGGHSAWQFLQISHEGRRYHRRL